jgi:multidrug resistance efflux pump
MGSLRTRLGSKPVLFAAAVALAGVGLFAFAEAPPTDAPAAASATQSTATEKKVDKSTDKASEKPDKSLEKSPDKSPDKTATTSPTPSTSPTTSPATQPAGPTHPVKSGKLSFVVNGEGVFAADEPFEARLKLEAHSGQLIITSAAPNRAQVSKGATLLELDPVYINREVASAENDLTASKATLAKAEADSKLGEQADALAMRIQQQETKNAEAAVSWWEKVDGPQILTSAKLQVKMAKANVEDQEDELDQLKKMYKDEDLTSQTADIVIKRAVRSLDVGKTSAKMTEERSEKTEAHTYAIAKQAVLDGLEQSKQRLEMLKVSQALAAVLRKTGLSSARLAAAASEKKLNDLKKDQSLFSIKAPSDGVVLYGYSSGGTWTGGDPKTMRVGERLSSGQTVMTLFKPGDLKVEFTVPESQSAWVRPGCKARVTPVAYPELSYEGGCAAPAAKPGASGLTFATTINLDDVDARIMPGMKATVRIDGGEADGVLLVPVAAVSNNKVWVRGKDGQEQPKDVVTGRSDGKMIEIKQGLGEGDLVLPEAKK